MVVGGEDACFLLPIDEADSEFVEFLLLKDAVDDSAVVRAGTSSSQFAMLLTALDTAGWTGLGQWSVRGGLDRSRGDELPAECRLFDADFVLLPSHLMGAELALSGARSLP